VSVIAFFLPNISITIDVIGNQSISMLGLVMSVISQAASGNSSSGQYYFHSLSAPNFWEDIVKNRDGAGGVLCAVSLLLLMGHYLLTVAWGFFTFALKQRHRLLTFLWLFSAAQYPIIFFIGARIMLNGMKPGFGDALVSDLALRPGLITWLLMLLAWVPLVRLMNPFGCQNWKSVKR